MAEHQPGEGIGHFFGAMRIDAFRPADEFKLHMDKWINRFRTAKTIDGQARVMVPGEPETEMEMERKQNGIPLMQTVIDDLRSLATKFGIQFQ